MGIKTGILLFVYFLSCHFSFSQAGVNYRPKALLKAMQKAAIADMSVLEEIGLPDSVIQSNQINGKYFLINKNNESQYKYVYVGRASSCRAGGCSIIGKKANDSHSEYFDYYIIFDTNKTVRVVKVFNYQATHGHEITAKGWLKQFIGYNPSKSLQVNKDIDTISGATVSVYAIITDVEMKTKILKYLK